MNLRELQKNWNRFGKEDPLWAISTVAEKKGNKWELDKFFETGAKEIAEILDHTSALGMAIDKHKALDFGCGVGRPTQAMATHFEEVAGVDIAPSMLKLARKYNRFGERCTYYRNQAADLRLFADNTFDFIYTNMVLQHMRPSYAKTYIREFLRVATPRGVIVFQLAGGELPKSTKPEPSPVIPQPEPQGGAVRTIKDLIKQRPDQVGHAVTSAEMVPRRSVWATDHGNVQRHKRRSRSHRSGEQRENLGSPPG